MNPRPKLPRALVITRNLPPLVGGMERLVWHIVDELRLDYRVHVIGPAGCRSHLPPDVAATEIPLKPTYWYLLRCKLAAVWVAVRMRPRIVFAGSGLTAPFAWLAGRLVGSRCVVYLHGLDIEARHPLYRLLWRPFLRHFDLVLVNSRFSARLAQDANIPSGRICILSPGVNIPDLTTSTRLRKNFRESHSLNDDPLLLYVGRITARKGLAIFLREILPQVIAARPDAKVVVIGDEPKSALLQDTGQRKGIEEMLPIAGLSTYVLLFGELPQDDPELTAAYFAADVLIFPVQQRKHDNEGFGMVAVEAAAHGLHTVAFAVGGVADAIANSVSGDLITPGDNNAFAGAVISQLNRDTRKSRDICREFAAQFAWPKFGKRLRRLLDEQ